MRKELKHITLENLDQAAVQVIEYLGEEKVLFVEAPVGGGKTTFIRALCRRLGVHDNVSSPTFSIINEYRTEKGEIIYHFDLYRLKTREEVLETGFAEYLESGKLCIIEWPDMIEDIPDRCVRLNIHPENDQSRTFVLQFKA